MNIIIIISKSTIIGVADSIENAEKMILEYYGKYKEINCIDVRDSGIEYIKYIEILDINNKPCLVEISLLNYIINSI